MALLQHSAGLTSHLQARSAAGRRPFTGTLARPAPTVALSRPVLLVRCSSEPSKATETSEPAAAAPDMENPDSELARKKAEADRLRAAEKFMVIGSGSASCKSCNYEYKPERGDPDFPVSKGTLFKDLPEDYYCPVCGAPKQQFESKAMVVAGFAENQKYGLGTNSMTSSQKNLIIWGTLAFFFVLFIGGYALE